MLPVTKLVLLDMVEESEAVLSPPSNKYKINQTVKSRTTYIPNSALLGG